MLRSNVVNPAELIPMTVKVSVSEYPVEVVLIIVSTGAVIVPWS